MRRRIVMALAWLALLATGLDFQPEAEEPIEDYGCICDGAQGECRPHPWADASIVCSEPEPSEE